MEGLRNILRDPPVSAGRSPQAPAEGRPSLPGERKRAGNGCYVIIDFIYCIKQQ